MKTAVVLLATLNFILCACATSITPWSPYNTREDRDFIVKKYDSLLEYWPKPFKSEMIQTSLGSTHVLVNGPEDGEAVIFLHGAMANALMYKDIVRGLQDKYRTIAIDVVGHFGKSIPTKTGISAMELVSWINEILDHYSIKKTSVISASFGGWVAMKYAIVSNDRLNKLVLVTSAPSSPTISATLLGRMMKMMFSKSEENVRGVVDYMYGSENAADSKMIDFMTEAMKRARPILNKPKSFYFSELKAIKQPVLVIGAEKDRLYKWKDVEKSSKKYFTNVKVIQIKDSGHFVFAEKPDLINQYIIDFLGGREPARE